MRASLRSLFGDSIEAIERKLKVSGWLLIASASGLLAMSLWGLLGTGSNFSKNFWSVMLTIVSACIATGSFAIQFRKLREAKSLSQEPPRIAEILTILAADPRHREALLQSLDELFDRDMSAGMSLRRARLRYVARALASVGGRLWSAAKGIGVFGLLAELFRRCFPS